MREYLFQLLETSGGELSAETILLRLVVSAVIAAFLFLSYRLSHSGSIYSAKFNVSLAALTVIDLVFTLLQISALGKKFRQLERVNKFLRTGSDKIGSVLSAATLKGKAAVGKLRQSQAYRDLHEHLEDAHYHTAKQQDALYEKIGNSRLAKAFPSLAPSPERRAKLKARLRAYEEKRKSSQTNTPPKDEK